MRRPVRLGVVAAVLAALCVGLALLQFVVKPVMLKAILAKALAQPPAMVSTVVATTQEWQSSIEAIGTFRAVAGIDVSAQVGGVLRAIGVESGQDVAAGTIVVEIDDSVEQADLRANEAALKNAQLTLDRQNVLVKDGNTTKANYDQALAQRDQASAAVERSKALIAQKKIAAAFAGRSGLRKVDVGQYVAPGQAIMTLQQLDPLYVDFPVTEQDLGRISKGQPITIRVDAQPGRVFAGVIDTPDARVNADSRTIQVRAKVANADKVLLPGMFAHVQVSVGAPQKRVTLPRTAVTPSLYGDSVYVVVPAPAGQEGLVAERRFVRVGGARDGVVSIVEGVAESERVVAEGQIKLQPGAAVRLDSAPPLAIQPTATRAKE